MFNKNFHIDLLNYILPPHVPSPPGPPPQNAPLFSSSLSPTPHLTQCLVDNETPDNRTPLHYASRKGNFECIKALLAYASTRLGSMDGSTYSKKELPKGANRAADAIEGRQKTAEHVLLGKKTSKGRLAEDEAEIADYKDVKDFLNERRNKLNNNDDQQRRSIDIKDANEKIKSLNRNNDTNTLNNSTRGLFEPGNARKETENLFNSINN